MLRFIHSSDLHLGKRFGQLPEDLRGRLREARHAAIQRLAEQARAHGADTVLLAGDTFDTETPAPEILRQALAAMRDHAPLRWILLPGNHDSLAADPLWTAMRAAAPDNVTLAVEPAPIALGDNAVLLPAPCPARRPGRDLTEWMDGAITPDGAVRIGLAHGAIQSFSEDSGASDILAPDRAQRAGLSYLALGDWHGRMQINERTFYSGTPEPDRFKHAEPGQALLVGIDGPSAPPQVTPLPTGSFTWQTLELALMSGDDAAARLAGHLVTGAARRQTLLRVVASGRCSVASRSALLTALDKVAPEFAYAAIDDDALASDCTSTDLDLIDRSGALRNAAETLLTQSTDERLALEERDIARAALARLFAYCEKVAS